ncbi:MAG: aldose 1-epimerase family protein, partial [Spirochaetaceae bacterium]|nr:aldose 1-epimerase family protein [Spirochaetaceae bacterium]
SISSKGAELKSLIEKKSGVDYIWRGDPSWWSGTAPLLFPIVGGLKNKEYIYKGEKYSLPNHGFARQSDFSGIKTSSSKAVFTLTSSDETRLIYPFHFTLHVTFSLEISGLAVQYDVINNDSGSMFFSIGSHPAFNLPFAGGYLENYYIHFSEEEDMQRYFFEEGLYRNETAPILSNCRQISLNSRIFNKGPLIFKAPKSREIHIMNSKNSKEIIVSTGPLPYLAIWSKPGRAPFLCIEPWYGLPDRTDSDQIFENKEGIIRLDRGKSFSTTYRIEIAGNIINNNQL